MFIRRSLLIVPVVMCAACVLSGCRTSPDVADPPASPEFIAATNAWHTERLERLTAPDGWLSLVGLAWLQPGRNEVGRSADARVSCERFPADRIGTIIVGDDVRFEPFPGAEVKGVPADGVLQTDAQGAPTVLSADGVLFYVIERGGRLAVRIKDPSAPTRTGFSGIDRFPIDESWRIEAQFIASPEDERIVVGTVVGTREEIPILGRARFQIDGHQVAPVLFPAGDGSLVLRFSDATCGRETYPIGRYLSVDPPNSDGTVVLDFNRAYNPPCAFTPFATCT
ncbi:MAG: DUF1684 domain-containing protein, partial [Planctomycetota bacterium]